MPKDKNYIHLHIDKWHVSQINLDVEPKQK